MITTHLRAADHVALALHRLDPGSRTTAPPILLAHGAFTSHRVFLRGGRGGRGLAAFLQERGHDVWLVDWRHHGGSDREPARFQWQFEDLILRDTPAALSAVRETTGHHECIWVGHSFGGVIGLAAMARDPGTGPTAIVTLGTPDPDTGPLRRLFAWMTTLLCRALGRFPARFLRFGPEDEPARVLSEWMMWNVRGRWMGSDGFDYLAALRYLTTPFLTIAGSGDHLFAPPAACHALVTRLGGALTTFVVVPDLDHRGLVLDPHADERCWPVIADWIAERSVKARVVS